MALTKQITYTTCCGFSNFYSVRFLRSAYRLKPDSLKLTALDVNKTEEQKYQEKIVESVLSKARSPLRGFERVHITSRARGFSKPLPNEQFYDNDDLPRYRSYLRYVKEAERMRRKQREEGVFWKTKDHWLKIQCADPNYVNIGLELQSRKLSKEKRKALKEEIGRLISDPKMERAARKRTLKVDMDQFLSEWENSADEARDIHEVALHYNIYQDLFGHGHFYPLVPLEVSYDCEDGLVNPVYYGNELTPLEAAKIPNISFDSDNEQLWTLLVTNPDENIEDNDAEYVHWLIGNIKGNDITTGETLIDYFPPIPARGTGYQRMVFLLFQQDSWINFEDEKRSLPCLLLRERTFKTRQFYRKFEPNLIPVSLRFFQTKWDSSVQDTYHHTLDMAEPVYEFIPSDVDKLGRLKVWPHQKTLTWLKKFMPKEPIYPGGGAFT